MTIVSIWGVLGTVVARALLMPLAFLMFAVPIGESLIPKLQDFSAWFAVKMLDLSKVPVLLEGRSYESQQGQAVKLFAAYYAPGRLDAKVVSLANTLFGKQFWWRTGRGSRCDSWGQSFYVHETFIRSGQPFLVVWSWYWIEGRFTSDEFLAKYLLAKARFLGSHHGAAAIAIATAVATEDPPVPQRAAEVLKEFLNHVALQESLRSNGT